MHMTVRNGERCSTDLAYLAPAKGRPNLTIETRAEVERVLLKGERATGVRYVQGGAVKEALTDRDVVLCAGAIGTPVILQRSGIGAAVLSTTTASRLSTTFLASGPIFRTTSRCTSNIAAASPSR